MKKPDLSTKNDQQLLTSWASKRGFNPGYFLYDVEGYLKLRKKSFGIPLFVIAVTAYLVAINPAIPDMATKIGFVAAIAGIRFILSWVTSPHHFGNYKDERHFIRDWKEIQELDVRESYLHTTGMHIALAESDTTAEKPHALINSFNHAHSVLWKFGLCEKDKEFYTRKA